VAKAISEQKQGMVKQLNVAICAAATVLMTSAVSAQTATQEAKEKTSAAVQATGQVVSDAEITASVKSKLLADKTVGGLKLDVDTDKAVVTLKGKVHSATERDQALRLARSTSGVTRVVNKLEIETAATSGKSTTDKVKETTGTAVDKTKDAASKAGEATKDAAVQTKDVVADAAITSAVKTKFLADTKVAGLKIDVDTKDNVVTLTGMVNSVEEKNEALRLARTTSGVKRVVDKLTVK
jgi:osmotically-inducible protein OsmY